MRISTVLYLGMLLQVDHRRNYFSNAGLVVGSQQCGAVSHNQILTLVVQQFGKLSRTKDDIILFVQNYISPS